MRSTQRVAALAAGAVIGAVALGGCGPSGEVRNPRVQMMEEETATADADVD